jgi:hypothetical protein
MLTLDFKRGFKTKTIVQNIRGKIDSWLKTITDEKLREDVRKNYIVTGGAIASMLGGHLPNDYDVYLKNAEVAARLADYYIDQLVTEDTRKAYKIAAENLGDRVSIMVKSMGILTGENPGQDYRYFEAYPHEIAEKFFQKNWAQEKGKYKPLYVTSNAITLDDKIQICLRFVGLPEEIHKNYDFLHATNWYTEDDDLVIHQGALQCILTRELRYVGSVYPICSLFRMRKFIRRGWTITAGEVLKIAWDVNKLNLSDINVLREQLVGVDQAYFHQVISELQAKGDVDRTYLFEIINRIFDDPEIEDF